MQRARAKADLSLAARKAARPGSAAASGSAAAGGGRVARARTTTEKVSEPTTARPKSAVTSKATRQPPVKPATTAPPDSTPVGRKRPSTAPQQKKTRSGSTPEVAASNQEELQDESTDDAEVAYDVGSDVATINWILSGDYRLVTAVRVRPMLPLEKKKGYRRIVEMAPPDDGGWTRIVNPIALTTPLSPPPGDNDGSPTASLPPSKQFTHEFAFDHSFWSYDHAPGRQVATQGVVYESLGGLAIETLLQGFNCSILAYGQSGTGKTFTMMGSSTTSKTGATTSTSSSARMTSRNASRSASTPSASSGNSTASRQGLTPRICRGLFDRLEELHQDFGDKSSVHVSYVEVYNERVFDLLPAPASSKKPQEPLKVREHPEQGTYVENARQVRATTFEAIQTLLEEGNRQRSVAAATANVRSSRSHAVLTLTLAHLTPPPLSIGKEDQSAGIKKSKLYLVDLAGSERSDTAEANNYRQRESNIINKSLATLADVISALAKRGVTGNNINNNTASNVPFVPYRNSVLTRLLKQSLGGDATTVLLATISPCCAHFEDSLSTLKFIGRAKNALSVPKLSPSPASTLLSSQTTENQAAGLELVHQLQNEILELKGKLQTSPPASEARRPSFTLAWESPSPGSMISRCGKSSPDNQSFAQKGCISSTTKESEMQEEQDPLEAAKRWAMQTEASPLSPPTEELSTRRESSDSCSGEGLLEQELARLQSMLGKCEAPRTTDSPLPTKVNINLLTRVHALSNLVAIRRRWSQLLIVRAFVKWRITAAIPLRSVGMQTQMETPPTKGMTWNQPVQPLDALCHSVVSNFIFPASDSVDIPDLKPSVPEYSDIEQQEIDSNTLSIIIDSYDGLSSLEGGNVLEEDNISTPSTDDRSADNQQCILGKLASCLDSIDLARKSMGPTLRRLRGIATRIGTPSFAFSDVAEDGRSSIGIEQCLLVHIDKTLSKVGQYMDTMQCGLVQRTDATVSHGVAAMAAFELMEALIAAFCLHMVGRVSDQLVSGSSGCSIGRLELESQLQTFREQLIQLVQLVNVIMARGELHPRDHDVILLIVLEVSALCERILCVWQAIEQRKRHQLVNRRLTSASTEALDCLNGKLRSAESKARAFGESLDAKVLEISRAEEELAGAMERLHQMEEEHASQIATLEIQLVEAEARAIELEQNNIAAFTTAKAQATRIQQLELQLDELNNSIQLMKDQDGMLPGDEASPITLRCGSLMVRLEEELTSALSRMNAMENPTDRPEPVTSTTADPVESECLLSDDSIDMQFGHETGEASLYDDQYVTNERVASQACGTMGEEDEDQDIWALKAAMERDLLAASEHEHELESQLSDALAQVCRLQVQHDALVHSVESLNSELSEALGRVALLEDERLHHGNGTVEASDDIGDDGTLDSDDQRLPMAEEENRHGLQNAEEVLLPYDDQSMVEPCPTDIRRVVLLSEENRCAAALEQTNQFLAEDIVTGEQAHRTENENEHETTVARLNLQLEEATAGLAKYKHECNSASQEISALIERVQACEAERDSAVSIRADLEILLSQERNHNVQLRSQDHFSLDCLRADLDTSITAKKVELEAQEKQVIQLQENANSLMMLLEQVRECRIADKKDFEEQIAALQTENSILQQKACETDELLRCEKSTVYQRDVEVLSLRDKLSSTTIAIESLEAKCRESCADTVIIIERLNAEVAAKTLEVEKVEKRCNELSKDLEDEFDRRASLQAEFFARDKTVSNLQHQLDEFEQASCADLLSKGSIIVALKTELEQAADKIQALVSEVQNTEQAQKYALDANKALETESTILRTTVADLENALRLERENLGAVRLELNGATAAVTSTTVELDAASSMCSSLQHCLAHQVARFSELEVQYAEQQCRLDAIVQTSCEQWKRSWVDVMLQCGVFKATLRVTAAKNEDLERLVLHESAIARQFAGKLESFAIEFLRCEETKTDMIAKHGVLEKEIIQYQCQCDKMQAKIAELEALDHQREAEHMELQLLHNLTEQEKRRIQYSLEQSEVAIASIEAQAKLSQELLKTREVELKEVGVAKIALDSTVATLLCSAREMDDQWRMKESGLLEELSQTKLLVEELKHGGFETGRCLENEQSKVSDLMKQVEHFHNKESEQAKAMCALKSRIDELHTLIDASGERLQFKTDELQTLASQHELLKQQLDMLLADREALFAQSKQWKSSWADKASECDALNFQLSTLQSEVLQLRDVVAASATKASAQASELELLRFDLQNGTENTKQLEDKYSKLKDDLQNQVLLNENDRTEIQQKTVQLEQSETVITELMRQQESLGVEIKTLINRADTHDLLVRNVEHQLDDAQASLQRELGNSKELISQLESARTELGGRDTSLQVMAERISHLNKTIVSQRLSHDTLVEEYTSVTQQQGKLLQQLREEKETSLMTFSELESSHYFVAAHPDMFSRMRSALLLNQGIAANNYELSEECKRAVMRHLNSLDEWFERTIVSGLPDTSLEMAIPSGDASVSSSTAIIDFSDLDELLEIKPSYLDPSVELDTLTNELLELCVVNEATKQSRTDTIDTIRMPSESPSEDEERSSESSTTEWEDCGADLRVAEQVVPSGDLDDNNACDSGRPGVLSTKILKSEPEASGNDAEIAQLKSTIWRLKEALDAKDDMLGFMDGKLSYYEEMLGKHQPQQPRSELNQRRSPPSAAHSRRR